MPYAYDRPSNWRTIARQVMKAHNGICHVCGLPGANEVDHVIPVSQNGSHDPSNLAPIHSKPCHEAKTKAETDAGRRRRASSMWHPKEKHPGLL